MLCSGKPLILVLTISSQAGEISYRPGNAADSGFQRRVKRCTQIAKLALRRLLGKLSARFAGAIDLDTHSLAVVGKIQYYLVGVVIGLGRMPHNTHRLELGVLRKKFCSGISQTIDYLIENTI